MYVKIASILHETTSDGPHIRDSIYFQGCSIRCPQCHNKQLWDFKGGTLISTDDIVSQLTSDYITILGGEPFCQTDALLELLKLLKGRNVWVYTGFTYDQLLRFTNPKIKECMSLIDTLVYGPYDPALPRAKFRGSANQRILHLSNMEYED